MIARKHLVLLALVCVVSFQCVAAAEPDCLDREAERVVKLGYVLALDGRKQCLGSNTDGTSKLAQAFNSLPKDEPDVIVRAEKIEVVTRQLQSTANSWLKDAKDPAERSIWLTVSEAIDHELELLARTHETFDADGVRQWKILVFNPDRWQLTDDKVEMLPGVNLLVFDAASCASDPPAFDRCENYASRKDLLRVLNIGHELGQYIVHDEFIANLNRAILRDTQWTQYHEEALFQWPWEHVVNGYRMTNAKKKLCDTRNDGMRVGFCRVPSDQFIFLHPDVALQWVSGAENSSELHGAAYLEIVGKYSWTWDAEGKISKPRGWSVIALYSNLSGESEVGYGVMYHGKRNNTIALTVTDGHVGILASLAVADRFFTASDAARSKFAGMLKDMQGQLAAP